MQGVWTCSGIEENCSAELLVCASQSPYGGSENEQFYSCKGVTKSPFSETIFENDLNVAIKQVTNMIWMERLRI